MKPKAINAIGVGVLALALGLGVASCDDSTATDTSSGGGAVSFTYQPYDVETYGDPTELEATVTFWHTLGSSNRAWLEALIAEFNSIYPNITINHSQQGGYDDLKGKIDRIMTAGGGELPTMAYCYPDHVADYIDAGFSVPLDGFIDDPVLGFTEEEGSHEDANGNKLIGKDDYVASYWQEGCSYIAEGTYSVPWTKSTEVLFYNQDMFNRYGWTVPTTWEDMWELCRTIKESQAATIKGWKAPLGYDSDSNLFITMCMQRGIPYADNSLENPILFNNDQAKSMVRELKGYYDDKLFITKGVIENNSYTSTFFEQQQVAMMISSSGGTSYANTNNFQVAAAPAPYDGDGTQTYVSQGPSITFFTNSSWQERYAAWLFYKFCTRAENAAFMATSSTGYDPCRVSSYSTEYYLNWLEEQEGTIYSAASAVTRDISDKTFFTPVFKGSATVRDQVGGIISNVFMETQTIDQAFDAAYTNSYLASR